jgi:hypothetical protein
MEAVREGKSEDGSIESLLVGEGGRWEGYRVGSRRSGRSKPRRGSAFAPFHRRPVERGGLPYGSQAIFTLSSRVDQEKQRVERPGGDRRRSEEVEHVSEPRASRQSFSFLRRREMLEWNRMEVVASKERDRNA